MNVLTTEWIEKAEGDFATARREVQARVQPNLVAACFHAQQCAEKYLKAFLQENGVAFPKTHDLVELLELCLPHESDLEQNRSNLIVLDGYAVRYRYPGDSATRQDAREALRLIRLFRDYMRQTLGI